MSRKNIFDLVTNTFDLELELARIRRLFESEYVIQVANGGGCFSVLKYAKKFGFARWKNRGHCVDADDFLSIFEYDVLWESAQDDEHDLLTLIEIVYNFWYIAYSCRNLSRSYAHFYDEFVLLREIMDDCLAHYNYKGEYFPELEQLIVIEDKPEATAVAEIADDSISYKVLRYNHHMLKGDLQAKKDILLTIGTDLEPKRKQLKEIDSNLEDSIFYILNNLNLRHNNKSAGDKHYKQAVAQMENDSLENWYDELYQMMLLAYLQLDHEQRKKRIKELKQMVSQN